MKRKILFLILAIVIIFAGFEFYSLRQKQIERNGQSLPVKTPVQEKATSQPAPTQESGFNYDSYEPAVYEEFMAGIYEDYQQHIRQGNQGMDIYNSKHRLRMKLDQYPHKISTQEEQEDLGTAIGFSYVPQEAMEVFTHILRKDYKDLQLKFIFQGPLIPFLKDEAELGQTIDLYLIFVSHNQMSNDALFLVNEFDAN